MNDEAKNAERFIVCMYGDHGYGYQPMGLLDDYDAAKPLMRDLTKQGKWVEVYAFSATNERRRVTLWHPQD